MITSMAPDSRKKSNKLTLMVDNMDEDYDYCYECSGYGDDYYINSDGELECCCPQCPMNPLRNNDDWDD